MPGSDADAAAAESFSLHSSPAQISFAISAKRRRASAETMPVRLAPTPDFSRVFQLSRIASLALEMMRFLRRCLIVFPDFSQAARHAGAPFRCRLDIDASARLAALAFRQREISIILPLRASPARAA